MHDYRTTVLPRQRVVDGCNSRKVEQDLLSENVERWFTFYRIDQHAQACWSPHSSPTVPHAICVILVDAVPLLLPVLPVDSQLAH